MSSSADPSSFTIVWEDASEVPTTQELRQGLEKGSDEVKLETLRRIITVTLGGSPQVCFVSVHALIVALVPKSWLKTASTANANHTIHPPITK